MSASCALSFGALGLAYGFADLEAVVPVELNGLSARLAHEGALGAPSCSLPHGPRARDVRSFVAGAWGPEDRRVLLASSRSFPSTATGPLTLAFGNEASTTRSSGASAELFQQPGVGETAVGLRSERAPHRDANRLVSRDRRSAADP